MTQAKSKLSKSVLIGGIITVAILLGYFLPYKSIVKEVPTFYKVVNVIDGDTIRVEMNNQIKVIRLLGIDTPEISNPYKPEGCFGKEASDKTKEILTDKIVYLIPDPITPDKDNFSRLLRYVFLSDGTLINAELIEKGYAFNCIYEPFQLMKQFDYLEKQAKEKRLGLWSDKCNYYFDTSK